MHNVTVGTNMDKPGCPQIGDDVFIGAGAVVVGNIKIGDGALIAANSLVFFDVPDDALAMGVPAVIYPGKSRLRRPITGRRGHGRLSVFHVLLDHRGGQFRFLLLERGLRLSHRVLAALQLMHSGHFRNVPVLDGRGRLVGNLTDHALVQHLCERLEREILTLPPNPDQVPDTAEGA